MKYIIGADIEKALKEIYRVYLCGNLCVPQPELQCIHDGHIEIGISYYKNYTADKPHFHKNSTEYNFILQGSSKVLLLKENKEYLFNKGSLFVIPPNTKYAFKHNKNTKILFIKSPGGNDKTTFPIDNKLQFWLNSW